MKIGVLIKQVPDTETKIKIKADGSGIEEGEIKYVVSPYDEYAIEEALQTKGKVPGSETFVISLGPTRAVESIRTALAMGIDKGVHVNSETTIYDSLQTATILAQVCKNLGLDLIFCGKQAIDGDNGQVTQMIAELMDIGQVMIAHKFELSDDHKTATITRAVSGGTQEIYEAALPVIVGCDKGLNTPRYASLPGIMKAKSKPLENVAAADQLGGMEAKIQFINYQLPPKRAAGKLIDGEPPQQAAELVRLLREEAKII